MVRLVVVATLPAHVEVLTPAGHVVTDCATAPWKSSSPSHSNDPVNQEPKKDDLPWKSGEKKEALRQVPSRIAVQAPALSRTRMSPPVPAAEPAALDDVSLVEHLRRLARPAVVQVFRN